MTGRGVEGWGGCAGHVQSRECLHRELRAIPGTGLLQVIEIEEMGWVSLPASRENMHRLAENLDRGGRERYVDSANGRAKLETQTEQTYPASTTRPRQKQEARKSVLSFMGTMILRMG